MLLHFLLLLPSRRRKHFSITHSLTHYSSSPTTRNTGDRGTDLALESSSAPRLRTLASASPALSPRAQAACAAASAASRARTPPLEVRHSSDAPGLQPLVPPGASTATTRTSAALARAAEASGSEVNETDLELTVIASWCAAHGLAEMSGFTKFKRLKEELGGERAFLIAVLDHLGMYRQPPQH